MVARIIEVPDYDFSGFYYPEIKLALEDYRRVNAQELTSDDENESHVQMENAFALVGHLTNTRLDVAANELLLDSAQLRESVRELFKLIHVTLDSATPSTALQVIKLASIITTDITAFVPEFSKFSTESELGDDVIFEATEDWPLGRGDEIDYVFAETNVSGLLFDGAVSSSLPTQFNSVSSPFTAADVGRFLWVTRASNANAGIYEITQFVDTDNVVVSGAKFVTETVLGFMVFEFSANFESEANDSITEFTPWSSFAANNKLYFGHLTNQWNQIDLDIGSTVATDLTLVWEYYDPTFSDANPTSIEDVGSFIRMNVNSLIGTVDRRDGEVRVTYNPTGVTEVLNVFQDGGANKIATKTLLGQSTVDLNALNYTIGADWIPLENQVDGTVSGGSAFAQDGILTFKYPMTRDSRWQKATINNVEAYWLRVRLVDLTGPTPTVPDFLQVQIDQADQFFPFTVVQGETIENEIIGSSNGEANQTFPLSTGPLFDGTDEIEVDETGTQTWVPWVRVPSFVKSRATDRHYTITTDEDGIGTPKFGSGIKGRIPPTFANNIRSSYRFGGEIDGNVGFEQITGNTDGIQFVSDMGNPMAATGWSDKEGGTVADLERVKDEGPTEIRRQDKVISAPDAATVAVDEYRTEDGSKLVFRAFGIEESFGPKTIELVVVGSGGSFLTEDQLTELDTFFNGDKFVVPPVQGVVLMNHEVTSSNYLANEIDYTAVITAKGLTNAEATQAVKDYLDPLAVDVNGEFVHKFGGLVSVSKLDCSIIDSAPSKISNIVRTLPAADVSLGPRELPKFGTISISIVEG